MTTKASKAKQPAKLFPQEVRLIALLGSRPDGCASIRQIGNAVFTGKTLAKLQGDRRMMHQRVGTIVYRINRKRRSYNIAPAPDRPGWYALRANH